MTATQLKVLTAINRRGECGANLVADVLWPQSHKTLSLRAGQYVGRLCRCGWVAKRYDEYRGRRGHMVACGVRYSLTSKGRDALNAALAAELQERLDEQARRK